MNRDQAKGKAKELEGDIEQKAGKLTGDSGTRARGMAKEIEGKLQKGVGNVKDKLDIDDDVDLEPDDTLRRDSDL